MYLNHTQAQTICLGKWFSTLEQQIIKYMTTNFQLLSNLYLTRNTVYTFFIFSFLNRLGAHLHLSVKPELLEDLLVPVLAIYKAVLFLYSKEWVIQKYINRWSQYPSSFIKYKAQFSESFLEKNKHQLYLHLFSYKH